MRIVEVIGTVTLSAHHPSLSGARWLVGIPLCRQTLQGLKQPSAEELVIYDDLGATNGNRIGCSEGAEAAQPFLPLKKPIDAYCACILDTVSLDRS